MSLKQNKTPFIGPALIGACLAVVVSVPTAAYLGALFGNSYDTRALIYCGLLLWAIVGAVSIFCITRQAEQNTLSLGHIVLWFVSAWLWPLLVIVWYTRRVKK